MGLREATLKEQFWFLRSRIPSYSLSSSPTDLTFDQTTSPGGFSFSEQEITTVTTGSQEDHLLRETNYHYVCYQHT